MYKRIYTYLDVKKCYAHTNTHMNNIHIYKYLCMYIYICIYVCKCFVWLFVYVLSKLFIYDGIIMYVNASANIFWYLIYEHLHPGVLPLLQPCFLVETTDLLLLQFCFESLEIRPLFRPFALKRLLLRVHALGYLGRKWWESPVTFRMPRTGSQPATKPVHQTRTGIVHQSQPGYSWIYYWHGFVGK